MRHKNHNMLSLKHKKLNIDTHIVNINRLGGHIMVHGMKHAGKLTIVKEYARTYNLHMIEVAPATQDLNQRVEGLYSSIETSIIVCIPGLDETKKSFQKQICGLIDRFGDRIQFFATVSSHSTVSELRSRFLVYRVPPLDALKRQNICENVCTSDGIPYIHIGESDALTVHDLLLHMDLKRNGLPLSMTDYWKVLAEELVSNIQSLSHVQIRTIVYKIFASSQSMRSLIKHLALRLTEHAEHNSAKSCIIREAAKYEHSMCMGNKDIYHIEAFIASIKSMR